MSAQDYNATLNQLEGLKYTASANLDDINVDEITAKVKVYSEKIVEYLNLLSVTTGIPVETMMKYGLIFLVGLTLIGTLKDIASNIIGIAYPLFKSIECLESEDQAQDRLWLTYWVCFASFVIFDQIAGRLLLGKIVPFYFFIKILFLIYLFHPQTMGARAIYANVLQPLLRGNQA